MVRVTQRRTALQQPLLHLLLRELKVQHQAAWVKYISAAETAMRNEQERTRMGRKFEELEILESLKVLKRPREAVYQEWSSTLGHGVLKKSNCDLHKTGGMG